MTTKDLAKELDRLARELSSLSYEASENVAAKLELNRLKHGGDGGGKYEPKRLTLCSIGAALGAAERAAGPRAHELRSDVFNRRVDKLAPQYADQLVTTVKNGARVPAGETVVRSVAKRSPSARLFWDVVGSFNHSPLAAELYAWDRAVDYTVCRLVPSYARSALEAVARPQEKPGRDYLDIAQDYRAAIDKWIEGNTEFRCEFDTAGKVVRVNGVDPTPFAALLATVNGGNADPIGIFGQARVPGLQVGP